MSEIVGHLGAGADRPVAPPPSDGIRFNFLKITQQTLRLISLAQQYTTANDNFASIIDARIFWALGGGATLPNVRVPYGDGVAELENYICSSLVS